jgi:hypothetical protein
MHLMKRTLVVVLAVTAALGCKSGKNGADGGSSGGGLFGGFSFLGDKPFEGVIDMEVDNKKDTKPPVTITYEVKQPKMRFDLPADASNPSLSKGAWALVDPPQKKAWLVVDAEKKAIVVDFDKMKEQTKGLPGAGGGSTGTPSAPSKPPPKITKTGKEDKVAGYACEIWNIEDEGKKVEICAAKGITWVDTGLFGSAPKEAWMLQLTDANHFPLRMIAYSAAGVEETRMEAKRIEKKAMPDARFVVPEGYQIVDVAQLMSGLMGGGRPPGLGSVNAPAFGSGRPPFGRPPALK